MPYTIGQRIRVAAFTNSRIVGWWDDRPEYAARLGLGHPPAMSDEDAAHVRLTYDVEPLAGVEGVVVERAPFSGDKITVQLEGLATVRCFHPAALECVAALTPSKGR
jgi:hypothetical protein